MIKPMVDRTLTHPSSVECQQYPECCLVVDDSPATRELICSVLQKRNIRSSQANNGLDAWQLLHAQQFDLVITDIEMPTWSGMDLVHAMRQSRHPEICTTAVIVTSSVTDPATRDLARSYGSAYFMAKPIDANELDVMLRLITTAQKL